MKLRTLIVVIGAIFLGTAVLVGSFVVSAGREAAAFARQEAITQQLIRSVFEQNVLAREYVSRRDTRPKEQWYVSHEQLDRLLSSPELLTGPNQERVLQLQNGVDGLRRVFDTLVRQIESPVADPRLTAQIEGDLLVLARSVSRIAESIATDAFNDAEALREKTNRTVLVVFGTLAALVLALLLVIHFRVVRSVQRLRDGAIRIGSGDLDSRIAIARKDEIGDLSHAFDDMAGKLKDSRDLLEQRIAERTIELRELNRRYELLIESIGDGVIAIDRAWNVTIWNKTAHQLTGWAAADVIGKPFRSVARFIHLTERTENVGFIERTMVYGEVQKMDEDTVLIRKDGTEIPVADSSAPILDKEGSVVGAIIVFRDISQEKEIDRMKQDLLFSAVHDLRGPATVISQVLSVFDDDGLAKRIPEYAKYIEYVRDADKKMLDLIQRLLDSGKKQKVGMEFAADPVDPGSVMAKALKAHRPLAQEKGIAYEVPTGELPRVLADAPRLEEVFDNLVSNAIKYGKKDGHIIFKAEPRNGMLVMTVTDDGIGIGPNDLPKIFSPYFRTLQAQSVMGSGIGLYVVKVMVEKMGGKVAVTSEEGKGSTFTVELPLAA